MKTNPPTNPPATLSSRLNAEGAVCGVSLNAFAGLAVSSAFLMAPGIQAGTPPLPTGAQTVSGASTVSQSGTTLTVTQTSDKAATNWQSFNISAGHTVNFVQPSASAVSLNRVIGNDVSVIQGAINANGHVFLLNPNGVLFTSSAQVNVCGIVASTLRMNTEDFMAGRYSFEGAGGGTIVNQGNITAARGGFVGLIAAKVTNTGSIVAPEGSILVGAGNRVTLDLGGPIKIKVEEGVLDALVEQGGAIRADGGLVYLTAKAVGEVTRTVINHTGITEARTISAGKDGKIYLMGGMEKDRVAVAGKLDASAPNGGDGGFIETSAAQVQIADKARVTTLAKQGKTGTWLVDPGDFTIIAGEGGSVADGVAAGSSIGATTLGQSLTWNNVMIETSSGSEGNGDITVNAAVTRAFSFEADGTTTLTLAADRNVIISGAISGGVSSPLNIVLAARATEGSVGYIAVNADLRSFGGNITLGGGDAAATGFAVGHSVYPGIMLDTGINIDATASNSSAGSSGAAERNTVLPTSSGGGSIVLRGTGASEEQFQGAGIRLRGNNSIVTDGAGSISIEGNGGNSTSMNSATYNSAGMVLSSSVYIKAKTGDIRLTGYKGSGYGRFGIAVAADSSGPLFIGTNGGIGIHGDSLALLGGETRLDAATESFISAPVVGGNTGNSSYTLTKTGLGTLTFLANAAEWETPEGTSPTKTTGTFSDANETLFGEVLARADALYAFQEIAVTLDTPITSNTEVKSTLNSVYIVPPIVSHPASVQLNLGLKLVEVAPAARSQSNENSGAGAFGFDPVAAAKRAPGTVLVLTGGVKRAADDVEERADKKNDSKR